MSIGIGEGDRRFLGACCFIRLVGPGGVRVFCLVVLLWGVYRVLNVLIVSCWIRWGCVGGLVPEGSVYRFLAEHRLRLFPDGMFSDLFGSGRGRPSVPGSVIGVVLVLQALEAVSDREAVQRLRCDIRWKAAAGLSLVDEGFHPTVLTRWRARLRASKKPERIFDAVREVVTESGVLDGRSRRALDSTILDDAVATQDTVTIISSQIRRCRRLIPEAADVVLVAHDYESKAKPSCDWSDPESRSG